MSLWAWSQEAHADARMIRGLWSRVERARKVKQARIDEWWYVLTQTDQSPRLFEARRIAAEAVEAFEYNRYERAFEGHRTKCG